MPVIARYALVSLTPLILILLGATLWGGFAVAALIWLTLIAAGLDHVLAAPKRDADDHAPWSDLLSIVLGTGHLIVLPVVLVALAIAPHLSFGTGLALLAATASFFGQVSHPNAHELIHRRPWPLRALGAAVYTSVGFGHHVSAHRLVHHRHVGTDKDPNTPLPGESFWAYLPRAWAGSFQAGLECEEDRMERRGLPERHPLNPYYLWIGGALAALVAAAFIAGTIGVIGWLILAMLTAGQILMSDYIQHYGLQRLELPNGRVEPVRPHHSWNAPRGFSSYLMLNAPAHSEHHIHPDTPYDRLDPQAEGPTLPYSMPIMAMIATVPSLWSKMMDKRALKVMTAAQDRLQRGASPAPVEHPTDHTDAETDALIARATRAAE